MTQDLRDQLQQSLGDTFTVDRELGGGGMSRVFVATDTTLERQIVVKMVPPQAAQSVSVERFKREIRVAAKLQHPHIVPVLSAGESGGLPFYTMPFVSGESLRHRLARGGELSVNETVHVLRDIAAALAYAHGQGVVHRDIKPENVMLSGGVAVVTDFGVAKAMDLSITDGGHVATGLTSLGVALGTPAYMSPEQATADPHVDHRSDIYSFGCVAYEMLTGSSPFAGRGPQQLLAAHVQDTVEPVERRRQSVPPSLAALVMKCLQKRPGDRPQSADELLAAIDSIATPSGGMMPTEARPAVHSASRRRWPWVAAAGLLLAFIGTFVVFQLVPDPLFVIGQATQVISTAEIEIAPAISPDGKLVAFAAGAPGREKIYVSQVSGGRPVLLTGELGGAHYSPTWSPDGSSILFEATESAERRATGGTGAAYVVPALGGVPRLLFRADNRGVSNPTFSPDGHWIAYGDGIGLWVRPADGGEGQLLVKGGDFHSTAWSPDSRLIAFAAGNRTTLDNVSVASISVVNLAGGEAVEVADARYVNTSPVWTPDGRHLLFVSTRDGTPDVFQQRLRRDGRPDGAPIRLTTGLYARSISLSDDGTRLAYDVVRNRSNVWRVTLPPIGAASMSEAQPVTTGYERVEGMRLSHDGKWLAFDSDRGGNSDVYKLRLDGGDPVQLTRTETNEFSPAWSPDDQQIAYYSPRDGNRDIYVATADGAGERRITTDDVQDYRPDWSADGRRILFDGNAGGPPEHVFVTARRDADTWSKPEAAGPEATLVYGARWAPDGRSFSTAADGRLFLTRLEGGASQLLVDLREAGERVVFSAWGQNPDIVFFNTLSTDGGYSFWSVPVARGTPRRVLMDEPLRRIGRRDFDTDGRQIFFTMSADESDIWVAEVRK